MRITDITVRQLDGEFEYDAPTDFWEERLLRPIDIYPEHKEELGMPVATERNARGAYDISSIFVTVETDEGVSGISGPIDLTSAFLIDTQIRPFLLGEDPLAAERVWDKLYRHLIHGRKGDPMFAISAIDIALWDLKGKWFGQPVYRLLGGPVRTEVPAYASALGFSIEPERAAQRTEQFVAEGYTATKWFFRKGPDDGEAGARSNLELMHSLRAAAGPDVEIMLDAWSSWNVRYTLDMAQRMLDDRPRWIEEPVKADDIPNYARLRAVSPVPIAGGEHEYTRWGARDYLRAGAVDVYQADPVWAGGISELVKIAAMCSAYDVALIPHGGTTPVNAHLSLAFAPTLCPYVEYLVKWNELRQLFSKHPVKPVNGRISLRDTPGIGMEIDPAKVKAERELAWRPGGSRARGFGAH